MKSLYLLIYHGAFLLSPTYTVDREMTVYSCLKTFRIMKKLNKNNKNLTLTNCKLNKNWSTIRGKGIMHGKSGYTVNRGTVNRGSTVSCPIIC